MFSFIKIFLFPFWATRHVFSDKLLIGPNDVGGQCPSSTYQYNDGGICSNGCCCCGHACCWNRCDYAPAHCITDVENSEWRYVDVLGYYRAFINSGKFIQCIRLKENVQYLRFNILGANE